MLKQFFLTCDLTFSTSIRVSAFVFHLKILTVILEYVYNISFE